MRQELADGNAVFVGPIEFQKIIGDGTVERKFAEFDKLRAKQPGHQRLGQRCEIVNCLKRRRSTLRLAHRIAEGIGEDCASMFSDTVNCGGEVAGIDPAKKHSRYVWLWIVDGKVRHRW